MENVEGFEVSWDHEKVYLKFTDLFGDGAIYILDHDEYHKLVAILKQSEELMGEL